MKIYAYILIPVILLPSILPANAGGIKDEINYTAWCYFGSDSVKSEYYDFFESVQIIFSISQDEQYIVVVGIRNHDLSLDIKSYYSMFGRMYIRASNKNGETRKFKLCLENDILLVKHNGITYKFYKYYDFLEEHENGL